MKKLHIYILPLLLLAGISAGCKNEKLVFEYEKFIYEAGNPDDIESPEPELVTLGGLTFEMNHIERPSQPLSMAFDGNMDTKYHSPWSTDNPPTEFPVILTVTLPDDAPSFDYMMYWPRQVGTNGRIIHWKVSLSTKVSPDTFVKVLETDYPGDALQKKIAIPSEYRGNIKKIEFYITEGLADVVSIQEIEFYNEVSSAGMPDIFTDNSCSELIEGVTREEIIAIDNTVFRNIALAIFDETYDYRRVKNYRSYPSPDEMAELNKTSTYSLLDNVTGIFVTKGEYLLVMVDGLESQASLRIINHDLTGSEGWNGQSILLNDGVNKIEAQYTGLVYLMFHNNNNETIRINFASAYVNDYYDINDPDRMDWDRLLANARASRIDMLGDYSHLIFPTSDLKQYTDNPDRLLEVYDSIVYLEEEFIGLYKYNRANKSRMLFRASESATYMHATAYRTEYNPSTMDRLCDWKKLRSSDIWGPAHEVGHVNQTRPGFRWKNESDESVLGEVSNNVYTMHVQKTFGNNSRLIEKGSYQAAYTTFMLEGIRHMDAVGAVDKKYFWEQLVHFWQLELYFSYVKGQKDFYKDVHEKIRNNPDPQPAKEHYAFAIIASEISGKDLSAFFNMYGYELDAATINAINNLNLPMPDQPLWYIDDSNIELFINKNALVEGTKSILENSGNFTFILNGWENVVAFEVKVDGELLYISQSGSFNVSLPPGNVTVEAIGAAGDVISVSI